MARLNIYVPDELAERARDAGLNVSALSQAAIAKALQSRGVDTWLEGLSVPSEDVTHEQAMTALDEARAELDA